MAENARKEFQEIVTDLFSFFTYQQAAGMDVIALRDASEMMSLLDTMEKKFSAQGNSSSETPTTLDDVRQELGECTRCGLCTARQNIVFGSGNPHASLVFVGEAPGREEDLAGEPFVGEAGQLLTRIIQAIKLQRQDVYICNIIKCRPPANRDPKPEEVEACLPFLKKQLRVIQPRIICALGKYAAQTLLETQAIISKIRGTVHTREGITIVPTFHPASLLRNPQWKREVWQDMQLIQKLLEDAL